jgi:hypothetical protein
MTDKVQVGWREWVALPELEIPTIKAKIDTGARTSALHVFELEPFQEDGRSKVNFRLHPLQRRIDIDTHCTAQVIDERLVRDSGGHQELRLVISTILQIGTLAWPIEVTLTNREDMSFRFLLGRSAMRGRLLVDPGLSYQMGRLRRSLYASKRSTRK